MGDVKIHKAFPTSIYEFEHKSSELEQKNMEKYISEADKNFEFHTEDNLHTVSHFTNLREKILQVSTQYINDLKYEYEKIEITGMWANVLSQGDVHPPHTHSNNFLSGVYYLKADENSPPTQFYDPRTQAHVLSPKKTPTWENSNVIAFKSIEGSGLVFPSWLLHLVPLSRMQIFDEKNKKWITRNELGEERISISWNILLRGEYGNPQSLQNAHI